MSEKKTIHSIEYKSLCEWLNSKRTEQALSIRQLADRLNWSHAVLGKVFVGDRKLDVVEYAKICEALAVDACDGLRHILNEKPPRTTPVPRSAAKPRPKGK